MNPWLYLNKNVNTGQKLLTLDSILFYSTLSSMELISISADFRACPHQLILIYTFNWEQVLLFKLILPLQATLQPTPPDNARLSDLQFRIFHCFIFLSFFLFQFQICFYCLNMFLVFKYLCF